MVAAQARDGSGSPREPDGRPRRRRRDGNVSDGPRVAVVGAGSWGTAVAALVSNNADTVLWVRRPDLAATIAERHENPDYLPGIALPDALRVTSDIGEACGSADVVVLGVPSHGMRSVLMEAAEFVNWLRQILHQFFCPTKLAVRRSILFGRQSCFHQESSAL